MGGEHVYGASVELGEGKRFTERPIFSMPLAANLCITKKKKFERVDFRDEMWYFMAGILFSLWPKRKSVLRPYKPNQQAAQQRSGVAAPL